ncbi:MAG TPA: (d)CMP kinase [Candidatus Saccharimonadia bacterium]|nr:(d)CMP kinase [Candidatus Saccharimonadia bacterium]
MRSMNVELKNKRVVAVDGGTATGKGRLIEELAQLLRGKGVPVIHISTGSVFRALSYLAIELKAPDVPEKLGLTDAEINHKALDLIRDMSADELMALARNHLIEMHNGHVWIDNEPASVDDQLKAPAVGTGASILGDVAEVRRWMTGITRRQINEFDGYVLIDGRDISHQVVPDAPLKLLLTVAPEVAAARSKEHTIEEVIARDTRDRARPFGQLKHPDDPGEGVIVVPTDEHSPESLRDHVFELMQGVFKGL